MLPVKKFLDRAIRLSNVNSNTMGTCYIFELFFIGLVLGMKGKQSYLQLTPQSPFLLYWWWWWWWIMMMMKKLCIYVWRHCCTQVTLGAGGVGSKCDLPSQTLKVNSRFNSKTIFRSNNNNKQQQQK